jgi:hypothetical protein
MALLSCVLFGLPATFIPDQKSVLRAYLMLEGSKVINAENAEVAIEDFGNKVDRLIDAIGDKEKTDASK